MVREDIVAGLKNAVERGFPLEKAKYSFISAGYSREEVERAAEFIHSSSLYSPKQERLPMPKIQVQKEKIPARKEPGKVKKNLKIILLVLILLVLIGIFIMTIIFREKIFSLFA